MQSYKALADKNLVGTEWKVIGVFVGLTIALLAVGLGKPLNIFFPVGTLAIGAWLYFKQPVFYVGFVIWLWFITPLMRRLIDYHSSFADPSPVLLSPILVTFISVISLYQALPKIHKMGGLPFLMALIGIFYAFLIGLIQQKPQAAILSFLDWASPVLFALHLAVHWQEYVQYRALLNKVFIVGTLVMGGYGVWQFLTAPAWDSFWLINSGTSSFGYPKPLGIRVWSTMNSPQAFAVTMIPGLLILFVNRGSLRFIAASVGYLAFFLSRARAPWLGMIFGLLLFFSSLRSSLQVKVIVSISVGIILILPLLSIEPFADIIGSRIETLSSVENDNSLRDRSLGYSRLFDQAIQEGIGKGLGYRIDDNNIGANDGTILPMLFSFGWIGVLPYIFGLFILVAQMFVPLHNVADPFFSVARGTVSGILAQVAFNLVLVAPMGVFLWTFLGLTVCARHYYASRSPSV